MSELCDFDAGSCRTGAPRDASPAAFERFSAFDIGLDRGTGAAFLRDEFERVARAHGRIGIFAQDLVAAVDEYEDLPENTMRCAGKLFHWAVADAHAAGDEVWRVCQAAEIWTVVLAAIAIDGDTVAALRRGKCIQATLRAVAAEPVAVAVSAYDDLGYIVWRRKARVPALIAERAGLPEPR